MSEFFSDVLELARAAFVEAKGEEVEPFFMALHPQWGITPPMPCGRMMTTQEQKDLLVSMLMNLVLRGASEIVFVSEIWRVSDKSPEVERRCSEWIAEHGSLETFPGRSEELAVSHHSDEGDTIQMAPIRRTAEGRELGDWVQVDGFAGRFTGIFKRARTIEGN